MLLEWWNGRHEGLKILWLLSAVRVQVPPRVLVKKYLSVNQCICRQILFLFGGFFEKINFIR